MTTEVGYVNPSATDPTTWTPGSVPDMWWWELTEQVPELRWPLSLVAFSRMPREDARVWSLLSAIKLPIRRTTFRIDPNGAEDDVVQFVAKDLGLPIVADGGGDRPKTPTGRQRDRFSWKSHLNEGLSHLRYGHSVFEQIYRYDDTDRRLHLRKLAPRPQFTIANFDVARDGGLRAIVQDEPAGGRAFNVGGSQTRIDVSRLVVYRNEPEPGVWIGTSLLRPSYKHWILKDELLRIEAAAARRNGIGVPVAYTNEADAKNQKRVDEYAQIASRFRSGMSSGAGFPAGARLEILGVQGNLPDIRSAIEYHDKSIALSGLAHFLNLDRGGSYALASVQADVFVQSVQALAEDFLDVTNQHVVEDMVDLNFGIDAGAPLIVCDEIGSRQDATAAALAMLVQAGLLDPDSALKAFIRQQLGAPALDPNYEPPAEPAAPAADPAPPALAPAANARKQSKATPGKMTLDTGQGELF